MDFTKAWALKLWREGDDTAIAKEVGTTKRTVRHWRLYGKKSKYEEAILAACEKRFQNRQLEWQLVPVEVSLPVA